MKKLILVIATISMTYGAYAQTDSTNRKMTPPDINHTNDGINQNRDLNNDQNRDMNNNRDMNHNRDMNNGRDQDMQNNTIDKTHPDGIMMQNGKMMIVKSGRATVLNQEITLSNGTRVMSDGTTIKKDGTKGMLKEGQHMDLSGNMVPMKTTKDKNMYLVPDSTKKTNY